MKSKQIGYMMMVAIIIVTAVAVWYNISPTNAIPPPPPPELIDTDGDGVDDTMISLSIIQPLRVVYTDGTDSWKYPSSRTSLTPLTITDTNPTKKVSSIQSYIYVNVVSSKAVTTLTLNCDTKIDILNENGGLYKNIADMPISKAISNPQNGTESYVTSATMSASDFQALIVPVGVEFNYRMIYRTILRDISAVIQFSDGTAVTMGLTGAQTDQYQLRWTFRLTQSGTVMSVTGSIVEWDWI